MVDDVTYNHAAILGGRKITIKSDGGKTVTLKKRITRGMLKRSHISPKSFGKALNVLKKKTPSRKRGGKRSKKSKKSKRSKKSVSSAPTPTPATK